MTVPSPLQPIEPIAPFRRDHLRPVAAFGVFLFAFSAAFSVALAYLGILMFTLAFVAEGRLLRPLLAEAVVIAGLGFAAFVASHSALWYLLAPSPDYAHAVASGGADWIKLLLFIPLAWWLADAPKRIGLALSLAALGLAFGFLRKVDWAALDAAFFAQQFDDYLPPLALGLYAGTAALGLIVCRTPFTARMKSRLPGWAALTIWATLFVLFLEILVLSFARSAWLGFAACLAIWGALAAIRALRPGGTSNRQRTLLSAVAIVVLVLVAAGLNLDNLSQRMAAEQEVLSQLTAGELEETNPGSIAIRVHGWLFGYELWSQRPWLGWGAGSSGYWMRASGLPQLQQHGSWLSDLHNTYFEVLFQFGLVGAALLGLFLGLLVRDAASASCRGSLDRRISPCVYKLLGLAAFFAGLWMLTNDRATNHDFRFFWMLVAGSAYALHLAAGQATRRKRSQDPTIIGDESR